ncbi:glutamate-5-semialdehyde dehydrogenase [Amycolatopsis sp. WAC 04197]|uniref:glutamate-5-semialdehyde dehydrogenase n=1 Tax=Amycolatopsis sp. WAC 04197 TaxID=2203199 RepID=UPI000F7A93E2|nr:glutamate-5-semialdehyde dehydrogenase [Amycolatopsis sp. WAC 04197]RSN46083.1 glutamate-5-semialdehyde dehydrogenase [Amycolatopsis sp. WAC 04197]
MSVTDVCRAAAEAWTELKGLTTERKNALLLDMAGAIEEHRDRIIAANEADVAAARENGVSATLVDRLTLTDRRMAGLVSAIRTIADLPDPVGQVVDGWTRPNGLLIERVREPIGVVAVIYEARPNVTAEVAALCVKSGNCAVLRGSSMAMATNTAVMAALDSAIARHDAVPAAAVQLVTDPSRDAAQELMRAKEFVDLLVPRGGPELIASVERHATVPTVIDGAGNCHVYIDRSADPTMATAVAINAKTSRPSVCNAMETLLVHEELAQDWLPGVLDELAAAGVEIRGDATVREVWPKAVAASEEDWGTEYLDLVLAVRVVPDVGAAIAHIDRWGTSNAEAIVARDIDVARRFAREVDSGSVFVNTSTRYSDGGEFGYGVEIGVSTQKLHVRGPIGLTALTTVKNVVWGTGQTRVV